MADIEGLGICSPKSREQPPAHRSAVGYGQFDALAGLTRTPTPASPRVPNSPATHRAALPPTSAVKKLTPVTVAVRPGKARDNTELDWYSPTPNTIGIVEVAALAASAAGALAPVAITPTFLRIDRVMNWVLHPVRVFRHRLRRLRRRRAAAAAVAASRGSECVATSRSQAGKPIAEVHPALAPVSDARFSGATPGEAARGRDVVFLPRARRVLPGGGRGVRRGPGPGRGPGRRLPRARSALYERYYGLHSAPELLPRFTYGLADVVGCRLRGATAIAAPGCFATAAQLALYPLAWAGLDVTPSLFAVTGSSGAGVQPRPDDPPSHAGAQPVRLLGARPPARGRGPAARGASGSAGPTPPPGS